MCIFVMHIHAHAHVDTCLYTHMQAHTGIHRPVCVVWEMCMPDEKAEPSRQETLLSMDLSFFCEHFISIFSNLINT